MGYTRIINLPAEQVYHHLLDFLNRPLNKDLEIEVKSSKEPSYIDAKISSGIMKIIVSPRDGKSLIELRITVSRELTFGWFIVWGFLFIVFLLNPKPFLGGTLGLIAFSSALIIANTKQSTRRKLLERVNMFFDNLGFTLYKEEHGTSPPDDYRRH